MSSDPAAFMLHEEENEIYTENIVRAVSCFLGRE